MKFNFFFFLFSIFLIISSLNVVFNKQPVQAVFFLILAFINTIGLLFIIEIDFIALLFFIVYVGAIAILFLFVIIILNLKDENSSTIISKIEIKKQNTNTFKLNFSVFFFCIFFIFKLKQDIIENKDKFKCKTIIIDQWTCYLDNLNLIDIFGQTLYSFYFFEILIVGLILILALLGTVILSKNDNIIYKSNYKQDIPTQLSRNAISAVYILKKYSKV